ncbi:MAG TPA: hypothetical protein PK208_02460 [Fibrobacteria bacterium]|nr:hypothetical protein [Fibrobacteria bacterium]
MTSDETPQVPTISPSILYAASQPGGPALTVADLHGMEVLGSVPVWVLGGLRLHRKGWRHLQAGWVVGVYEMDISAIADTSDDDTRLDKN